MGPIIEVMKNILLGFKNEPVGYSAKKLTAFFYVLCVLWIHLKYLSIGTAVSFLIYDGAMILILLGYIAAIQLIQLFKDGKDNPVT